MEDEVKISGADDDGWRTKAAAVFIDDIVITDPCYLERQGTMEDSAWGSETLEAWIRKKGGLVSRTYYGDWGCTVYEVDPVDHRIGEGLGAEVGEFCADSGRVCVVHLNDVLELNPKFEEWIMEHPWCATIVRGFMAQSAL